ncbi:hypothetical protein LTS15_006690 [Exophiala xenobiotica]|nr:hypothetical protein LTS15_006690 [Exophiala xenobiotica]
MDFKHIWQEYVVLKPHAGSFAIDDPDAAAYTNEDMDPIKRKDRTYEWYQMGLFWIAEGFNAAQLQVSSSAFSLGLNPGLCVVACLLGNIIVSVPCAASGYLGSKLGTNFPGTVRASFGLWGSKWAMIVRAVPCLIYYGIQTSLAGQAVQACVTAIWPSFRHWHVDAFPASAHITAQQLLCFVIFWLLSLPFLYLPIKTLRWLFVVKSILVPLYWTALFTWSITAAGGWPAHIWKKPSLPTDGMSVGYLFGICVNAAISGNATFAVNIMDISRHSKSNKAAWMTQLFALPVFVTLTELLGCTMAVASSVVYGEIQWNPLVTINNFDARGGKFFAGALFVFFNIMTNVTGNSVPFANDLTGLFPKYINIRRGQFVCAVIGFAICPWEIEAKATTFLAFMGAYTLFLGATTGVTMTDYFWVRRGYGISISHLFKPGNGGIYWYTHGFNWRAFVAWFVALAPLLPGMVQTMGVKVTNKGILNLYSWNYVLVVTFSALIYAGLTAISPVPVKTDDEDFGKLYLIDGLDAEGVAQGVEAKEERLHNNNEDGSRRGSEKKGFVLDTVEYRDPNRTYSDLAHVLARNPGFAPRTDVFTFENGASALLVHFRGTIPVNFRGNIYRFPISLWVPHTYPYEPPIWYVTPTEDMAIRPGQHRSNIVEFLSILSDVFAKEPPVVARGQTQQRPVQPTPPPVPPLPREIQPHPPNMPMSSPPPQHGGPPPPPPKQPSQGVLSPSPGSPGQPPSRYNAPPPLPPHPQSPGQRHQQQPYGNGDGPRSPGGMNYMPQRTSSLRQSMLPQEQQQHQYRPQASRPGDGQHYPAQQPPGPMSAPTGQAYDTRSQPDPYRPVPLQQAQLQHHPQHYPPGGQQPPPQQTHPQYYPRQTPSESKPAPAPDLMDSPFDIPLPGPTSTFSHPSNTNIPAPPIPINPEKEALLSHLSHQITSSLHNQITQSTSALPALHSQNAALQSTLHSLGSELSNLQTLHSTLTSNLSLLSTSLSKSDGVISSARQRASQSDIPHVDEMLVPPTVVARQLYDAACEEKGIEAAILALQEGFVRGRVGADVWSRKTRELAREEFKRRWMERKVAKGMGLDLSFYGS